MEPTQPTDNVSLFLSISNTTDREDALLFLEHSNQNLEKALELFFEKGPKFFKAVPIAPSKPPPPNKNENELLAKKYEAFFYEKEKKDSGFLSFIWSRNPETDLPFLTKGSPCDGIKKLFQTKYNKTFKFLNGGRVGENLLKAKKTDKVLMILLYQDTPDLASKLLKTFETPEFSSLASSKLHMIGLLSSEPDCQKLESLFPPAKSIPCLLFLSIDILEKPLYIDCLPITQNSPPIEAFIGGVLSTYKELCQYQLKVKAKVENEIKRKRTIHMPAPGMLWNPFFDSERDDTQFYETVPRTTQNPGDRHLIDQQNEDYLRAVELSKQQFESMAQLKGDKDKVEETKAEEVRIENERKIKEEQEKLESERKNREIIEKKEMLRGLIGQEPGEGESEAIAILFRFPDGKKANRRFGSRGKIEVLFAFIELSESQLESFDLIVTYPHLSLLDLKGKTISEVFPGSTQETLQIKPL